MNKKAKFSKLNKRKKSLIILSVLTVAIALLSIQRVFPKLTSLTDQTSRVALLNFTSSRVPLTFNYPVDFPITAASEEYVGSILNEIFFEDINFSDTYVPNARDDSYGYLTVKKIDIKDLQSYLENYYEVQAGVNIEIETVKAMNTTGYRVHIIQEALNGDSLTTTSDWIYFFYENGLLYEMALTNAKYKNSNPDDMNKIFTNILLPSMKFE